MKKALLMFCLLLPASSAYPNIIQDYNGGPNGVINYYEVPGGTYYYFDGMAMMHVCTVTTKVTAYRVGPPKIESSVSCT